MTTHASPTTQKSFAEEFTGPKGVSLMPGGYGRATFAIAPRTPMAVSGHGCYLRDDSGREVIDLHNNFTAMLHGHAHPVVTEAAVSAFRGGASFGLPNMNEIEHARHMLERMPYVDQIRYANSGTEAVMLAVRLSRAVSGRNKIIMVRMAYHGHSDMALVTSGELGRRGVPTGVSDDVIDITINDESELADVFSRHHGQIAAVIVDPLPNRAGLIKITPQFHQLARDLCDKNGSVLVSDEVIALRLGHGGAAVENGVVPDLVVMGKIIGGGTPVGAVAGKYELMNALDPFGAAIEHAGTFTGNPVTMAAGLASMSLYTAEEVGRLNALGETARAELSVALQPHGWEVRGQGSLFRFMPPTVPNASAKQMQTALWWEAYERGLLLGQNVACCLSTPMDADIVRDLTDRLIDAVLATSERSIG